ncbi:MAG: RusA family crossover junction endodeoxyribonuclease [Cyanobacteria bacterium J06626_14]
MSSSFKNPVLPFEFTLPGRPLSNQTKDKTRLKAWQAKVRHVASNLWQSDRPCDESVRMKLKLTYYFEAPDGKEDNVPDSDNIVKPIREALAGIVCDYDYQITDVISRRRNLSGSFRIKGMSSVLADAFIQGVEFVHVRIEVAPDPADLN